MSNQPLPLSAARAVAFCQAFDDRDAYMAEQPWQDRHRIGFEESVPLPGCPYCWGDAENVCWAEYTREMRTAVAPCGHRFTTELPIVVRRSGPGWASVEQWHP